MHLNQERTEVGGIKFGAWGYMGATSNQCLKTCNFISCWCTLPVFEFLKQTNFNGKYTIMKNLGGKL